MSAIQAVRIFVVKGTFRPGDNELHPRTATSRTLRALTAMGLAPVDATEWAIQRLARELERGPAWLLVSGVVPTERSFVVPPASATGKPLCAFGATRSGPRWPADDEARWSALLCRTGGNLDERYDPALPTFRSLYVDARTSPKVARQLEDSQCLEFAAALQPLRGAVRIIRDPRLDVHFDDYLRVLLAITSLQQGGAERVVVDLERTLESFGVHAFIVTLGRPTRRAYPMPARTIDVSRENDPMRSLATYGCFEGADLVHAHLLSAQQLAILTSVGLGAVVTVHNTEAGWPEGLRDLSPDHASLLLGCSFAVGQELELGTRGVPVRVAWNGVDVPVAFAGARMRLRREIGIGQDAYVLLAVANPRRQKRLELLPALLNATQRELTQRGDARPVHLVIAGDSAPRTREGEHAMGELHRAIASASRHATARASVGARVHLIGSRDDVASVLGACDVLVSTSAHEGHSVAQLEALAAGLPVVCTDVGGVRDIAYGHEGVSLLPHDVEANVTLAAQIMADRLQTPASAAAAAAVIRRNFSRESMGLRHATLYTRAARRLITRGRRREGIWLVTNNFSMGGAQSSARRLLLALKTQGVCVRAAVLDEQQAFPTPGRRSLEERGVRVLALPPPEEAAASRAAFELLSAIDDDLPECILFWNARPSHKLLIADAIFDIPIFDVSPGEMFYTALERQFARPLPGFPYRDARDYGKRLAGVIVKYESERARAEHYLGAPVHVIPNGVDLGVAPKERPEGELVIATAARLSPQKRLGDLLAALRLAAPYLPPHSILIAGAAERGSEEHARILREQSADLPVRWLGQIDDTRPMLDAAHLFAMISEPAGCPNASLEAIAAGLPVVATDVGGAAEQVIDGHNGRLVPRGDARAFAQALVELGRDPAKRHAMGVKSRAHAVARFNLERMVQDYRQTCLER